MGLECQKQDRVGPIKSYPLCPQIVNNFIRTGCARIESKSIRTSRRDRDRNCGSLMFDMGMHDPPMANPRDTNQPSYFPFRTHLRKIIFTNLTLLSIPLSS